MRVESKANVDRAFAWGVPYTRFRPFHDLHERAGLEWCFCGRPSLVIACRTLGAGVIVLCRECLQKDREDLVRQSVDYP